MPTDHETTRDRILAEASRLYADEGLAAFSMRKVAARVGLSAAAIYRHFDNKEKLLVAVCQEGFRLFGSYLWPALKATQPRERLTRTRQGYCRFGLENPHFYQVIFMTPVRFWGWEHMSEENRHSISATFHFLVDRVRECADAGLIAAQDAVEVAAELWAHGHGLVSLRIAGHLSDLDDQAFAQFYDRSCESQLRGFTPGLASPA